MTNEMWFQPLVWTDYKLAVIFTVLLPIILLLWGFIQKAEGVQRLLIVYWRVASLLMITVYLLIPSWPIGFVTGWFARVLIPISLWFWVDLNEEIADQPQRLLKLAVTSWRWATTIYCILGVIATAPSLQCALLTQAKIKSSFCKVWLEAPWGYGNIFHNGSSPGFLGFLGVVALCIYTIYLAYFILIRLAKQGRSAMEQ